MNLTIPVSAGELLDKITILEIKAEKIADEGKKKNVRRELEQLSGVADANIEATPEISGLIEALKTVNLKLWDIEDRIRLCEKNRDFGPDFIELARSVYRNNDERARVKYRINVLLGSGIVEEKSYEDY